MNKLTDLFSEFVLKAITMTEDFLASDLSQNINFEQFTGNRERLFSIIDQVSKQIDWNEVAEDTKMEFNRQIDYLKKLDEKLLVKLQEYQAELRRDIEQTVRSKDNLKGYNLNDVK